MNISYDYYRIFYYVAKYNSFTRAAEALKNNQPNITRTIKNMESTLGCTLFIRSNRGVTLTPEGERLFAHVSTAFEHIETAEQEIISERNLQSGTISIAASEVALHSFLLPVLKQFRQLYPNIRIRLSNHSTPQAISALQEGLADLAVVTTPMELPRSMCRTEIKSVQEVAVAGDAYSHLSARPLTLEELSRHPIICLGKQTMTHRLYAEWFLQNGLELAASIEAATADQILPLVRNDLGIGFVPEEFLMLESEHTGIYRLNLKEQLPNRFICLVKRTDHTLSVAAKKLEQMILS